MAPYSSSSVIQVSGSPEIPILFKLLFTPNSEGVLSNALSLEATVKILALNNRVFKTVFTHQFRIFRLLESMPDELYRAISYYFYILKWSPSTPVVENAAALFCCKAPEMFSELQNFTWLSIGMGVNRYW